jgi:uncharacterized SAM-binding protein YcdF (DUF218 family)
MRRRLIIAAAGVALAAAGLLLATVLRIDAQSDREEARPADAILILGAAEYNGRPSPVLRGRLDHALALWEKGMAPRMFTTGGMGGDPIFTEAEVGRDYLVAHGVPADRIVVENEGATTLHSLMAVAEIFRRMELSSCIVVSDGYHIYRVKQMLAARGISVYGSPRRSGSPTGWALWWLYLKQAAGLWLWRVGIGW